MAQNLRGLLTPVKSLFGGTVAFMAGNSLLGVVLPLRMEATGFPVALIGIIMAAYYLGLALGGFRAKRVILRIGHIRAFAVFAALTAAVCLAYAFFFHPAAWVILRIVNGFCIAGMTTTIESWLNERSSNETRGRILGYYMLAFYLAIALGQTLVNVAPVGGDDHLMISATLIGLALIPVAKTRLGEPNLSDLRALGVRQLFAASPVGVVGAAVAGTLIGSFYALGVVFARQIGLDVTEAAMFMSTVVIGGLAAQVPVGMLADRYDRRIIMSLMLIAVGSSWALLSNSIAVGLPVGVLMIMALAFGGAISSVYPLCVAQTFDRLERRYYVAASGRLLMVYSIGATIGPLLASALMSLYGPKSFFLFESAVAVSYALFVLVQVRKGPELPVEGREKFVPLPDISPVAMRMDPRTDPDTGEDGAAHPPR
ncbi:Predicted arabinose efflux permease, MFS family [Roseovarius nanhaiticus]|uniref:Predicted arabinose efflux permease, MFS family n=1 Tax=Roseovarius nanhaiticus TaxID=573024 RepID=A0A1N7FTN9_9RHOB|nr:MFS transporter [Roseovarius nanhaiticus]SEK45669.1 Predicted arabinose efflux permease, MFS family [Roseovarius nanhaiticus]SIS03690.1 Predicted arabinose efflux permease, MFS family [Roseovarius nanhaiticus]